MKFNEIEAFVFDFDGVLTDNSVLVNENGAESVFCSRADGLAFEVLRTLKIPTYILSTEKNVVVEARSNKLKIEAIYGVGNKVESIEKLAQNKGFKLHNVVFVGNDINDYKVMQCCGFTACPSDAHIKIKEICNIVLNSRGGSGVVRELLEDFFELDFIKILYS
jgi:3-deoxy-D-manno-octulosonate 8-phosphate phosphatase (KDO 8-P phosphatase)|nr:HAD hydrolase family protein [Pelagibacteraceae bacterium]